MFIETIGKTYLKNVKKKFKNVRKIRALDPCAENSVRKIRALIPCGCLNVRKILCGRSVRKVHVRKIRADFFCAVRRARKPNFDRLAIDLRARWVICSWSVFGGRMHDDNPSGKHRLIAIRRTRGN